MINMDATVTSIRLKSDEELQELYDRKVRHLYLGIESGLDDVLKFMRKSIPRIRRIKRSQESKKSD